MSQAVAQLPQQSSDKLARLLAPTPAHAIVQKGKYSYVTWRYVRDLLNEVFGLGGWDVRNVVATAPAPAAWAGRQGFACNVSLEVVLKGCDPDGGDIIVGGASGGFSEDPSFAAKSARSLAIVQALNLLGYNDDLASMSKSDEGLIQARDNAAKLFDTTKQLKVAIWKRIVELCKLAGRPVAPDATKQVSSMLFTEAIQMLGYEGQEQTRELLIQVYKDLCNATYDARNGIGHWVFAPAPLADVSTTSSRQKAVDAARAQLMAEVGRGQRDLAAATN